MVNPGLDGVAQPMLDCHPMPSQRAFSSRDASGIDTLGDLRGGISCFGHLPYLARYRVGQRVRFQGRHSTISAFPGVTVVEPVSSLADLAYPALGTPSGPSVTASATGPSAGTGLSGWAEITISGLLESYGLDGETE